MNMTVDDLKGEDIIDSRQIIEAQEELQQELDDAAELQEERELDDDEQALLDFDGENEVGSEWSYGATLIREDCFEDYARDLAESIGAIDPDANWPLTCIDWEQAARELAMDYHSIEFLGYDYYVRST